jgi:hypothetical protein
MKTLKLWVNNEGWTAFNYHELPDLYAVLFSGCKIIQNGNARLFNKFSSTSKG